MQIPNITKYMNKAQLPDETLVIIGPIKRKFVKPTAEETKKQLDKLCEHDLTKFQCSLDKMAKKNAANKTFKG